MRDNGTKFVFGAIATLAGAGVLARRGRRGSRGAQDSQDATWEKLSDLGTIYVSEDAPVALVRDLVALEPGLRRTLKQVGWPLDSCTMSTEILGPMLAARGWKGSQVIDGVFVPPWSRDPADGTGHDWIEIEHDGERFVVDAAVVQFEDQWGEPDDDEWYRTGFTRDLGWRR